MGLQVVGESTLLNSKQFSVGESNSMLGSEAEVLAAVNFISEKCECYEFSFYYEIYMYCVM